METSEHEPRSALFGVQPRESHAMAIHARVFVSDPQTICNHDPGISCATHVNLKIERCS